MEHVQGREATPSSLRVLVVEDDPTLRRLIEMALGRSCGRVTAVRTGAEAIRMVEQESFDAVACDVGLPDISGLRVIAAARETIPTAGIVAITGMVDVDVAVEAMKAGADDFLAKPFDPQPNGGTGDRRDHVGTRDAVRPGPGDRIRQHDRTGRRSAPGRLMLAVYRLAEWCAWPAAAWFAGELAVRWSAHVDGAAEAGLLTACAAATAAACRLRRRLGTPTQPG